MCILLIDNCIHSNRCFSTLAVTNDQFSLSAANWRHRVNRFKTCLQRFLHRLALQHTQGFSFNRKRLFRVNFTFTIHWMSQWIDNAPQHRFTHRDFNNPLCSFGQITFFYEGTFAKQHHSNIVFFEVESHSKHAVW